MDEETVFGDEVGDGNRSLLANGRRTSKDGEQHFQNHRDSILSWVSAAPGLSNCN